MADYKDPLDVAHRIYMDARRGIDGAEDPQRQGIFRGRMQAAAWIYGDLTGGLMVEHHFKMIEDPLKPDPPADPTSWEEIGPELLIAIKDLAWLIQRIVVPIHLSGDLKRRDNINAAKCARRLAGWADKKINAFIDPGEK